MGPWLSYDPLTSNNRDLVPSSVGDGISSLQKERKRNSSMPDAPPVLHSLTHSMSTLQCRTRMPGARPPSYLANSRNFHHLRFPASGNLRVAVAGRVAY
ncbi:hypothetical protein B9Z19DRAFT_1070233 [Tuber borchii]|uniref:Uncharacterized protein n=1 Tax=Tuber borchii TaxID=42251 RepID=A0A2T7A9I7_TUBBO|nr:hypothetical protein B9Z19DRAFT_1070233 [Tuber borchii]